jgi:hypothetical protein
MRNNKFWSGNLKGRDSFKIPDVGEMTVLKRILSKWAGVERR